MADQSLPTAIRPATAPPPLGRLAIQAWNTMRGLDWSAVDHVAELHGITDIETFIALLVAIRDDQAAQQD